VDQIDRSGQELGAEHPPPGSPRKGVGGVAGGAPVGEEAENT